MKKIVSLAAAVAMSTASVAYAGGIAPVAVEPEVFVVPEETGSFGSLGGNAGLLIGGLILAGALAYALSEDDTTPDSDDSEALR